MAIRGGPESRRLPRKEKLALTNQYIIPHIISANGVTGEHPEWLDARGACGEPRESWTSAGGRTGVRAGGRTGIRGKLQVDFGCSA